MAIEVYNWNTSNKDLDKIWSNTWTDLEIEKSIKGIAKDETLRWKLKYAPLNGQVLEAGCGIGQYVFYFQKLGFDSRGIDISTEEFGSAKLC